MDKEQKEIKTGINADKIQVNVDFEKMDNESFQYKQDEIKKTGTGDPTYKPRNFKEQFYFEDNGSLWINIGNTWKEFTPI